MSRQIRGVLALVCAALLASPAQSQTFPDKPIKLLIGWAAGGPTDVSARLFADVMSATLGQPVVMENRAGASGQIAHDVLKTTPADGYTIEIYTTPTVVGAILAGKTVTPTEVAPIALTYDAGGGLIINPAAPYLANVQTVKDLIAVVKANPGKIPYTSAGTGTTGHLAGAWIGIAEGLKWEHIAYKGVAPASVDVVAGRVGVVFGQVTNDAQLIKEGKLRVISTTGVARLQKYPGTPSLAESGYGQYSMSSWGGFAAPAGTPRQTIDKLAASVRAAFDRPEIVAKLATQIPEPAFQPAEVMARRLREDIENFSRVIREAGIKAE
jgi:tripartite-type tricarboxylate transporter receptor subunit TctC